MPSDIIAELPVIPAAINLVIDISELPINAAIMTSFEPDAILCPHHFRGNYSRYKTKPQHLFRVVALFGRVRLAFSKLLLTVQKLPLLTKKSAHLILENLECSFNHIGVIFSVS
jgi:hypothetical protein